MINFSELFHVNVHTYLLQGTSLLLGCLCPLCKFQFWILLLFYKTFKRRNHPLTSFFSPLPPPPNKKKKIRPTFRRIIRNQSTEQFSGLPYLYALLNCLLCTWYGMPLVSSDNLLVMTVNSIGAVFQLIYIILFIVYAEKTKKVVCPFKYACTWYVDEIPESLLCNSKLSFTFPLNVANSWGCLDCYWEFLCCMQS